MKERKLQVFVSSTYLDLKDERQAAVEAILTAGHIPAGMELFTAGDETQMDVIKRWIDESDVYLLILGGRYGSIEPKSGKSYTHLEYEYAAGQNKALFSVVMDDSALEQRVRSGAGTSVIEKENPAKLKEFNGIVISKLVKFWSNSDQIKLAIYETLREFSYREELIGWVRGDKTVNISKIAEELAKLSSENEQLRVRLAAFESAQNIAPTYNGLTFVEMKSLLESEELEWGMDAEGNIGCYQTLLDLLQSDGADLFGHYWTKYPKDCKEGQLLKYGIAEEGNINGDSYLTLSPDGRRFYLRLKLMTHDASKNSSVTNQ